MQTRPPQACQINGTAKHFVTGAYPRNFNMVGDTVLIATSFKSL